MSAPESDREKAHAEQFCEQFLSNEAGRPRFVMGTNMWADSIADVVDIDGFIDDFTSKIVHRGKTVLRRESVPKNSLVVSAVVLGRPITAARRLNELGLENLDYYAFRKYAKLSIAPVMYMDEFARDYERNKEKFEWLRRLLADSESVRIFDQLIRFRLSSSLTHMEGFTDCQDRQYFEDFLSLSDRDEVFVDVGGYDGFTTAEFIRRYPNFRAVHFFEPERRNIERARQKLQNARSVTYHQVGLSNRSGILRFSAKGSSSSISDDGEMEITVKRLDDAVAGPISFIKIDVEGAESTVLAGAEKTIREQRPKLAVSAYHKYDDFYTLPEQVLSYFNSYDMYMRHYTEGLTETVMFFVPRPA